ncbi:DUF4336 domain-containing protein [Microvirga splendida]|uniref:DUF4336 domain-containing protein n=1 Tax=Microvirga splendida TaxID=2795727 RepID=A0ABS0XZN2_9HYPH|nr:DUF4336 domain-containing protein [Microvirga splendida]MBJ6125517.1 DUF4336 domain-containing protein [Microvirga splendida]
MPSEDVTYPPLDVLKPVAENLWIVDSGPQEAMGLSLPVRMTVIRLGSGDVWLHSPTRYNAELRREIETLGSIRHLVAPNIAHWTHLKGWQGGCPAAKTSAAPKLRQRPQVRKAGLRLDRDLTDSPPDDWGSEIEQAVVPGGAGFREVAFFHRPTRTLILTDLIQNLEPQTLPLGTRLFARLTGVAAPDGKAPAYLRFVVRLRREEAKKAVSRMIAWNPERVIFSHGRWFDRDGTAALKRAFAWLLD